MVVAKQARPPRSRSNWPAPVSGSSATSGAGADRETWARTRAASDRPSPTSLDPDGLGHLAPRPILNALKSAEVGPGDSQRAHSVEA
jgi:hypothetical protein